MDNRSFESGASLTAPVAPIAPASGFVSGGNPATATPPTNLGPFWFHQIGEEIRAVIVAGGLTPDRSTLNQLLTALQALFAANVLGVVPPSGFVGPYIPVHGIEVAGFIIQVRSVSFGDVPVGAPGATGSATWLTEFPNNCLAVFPAFEVAPGGSASNNFSAAITAKSTTGCSYQVQEWASAVNPGTLNLLAIGF